MTYPLRSGMLHGLLLLLSLVCVLPVIDGTGALLSVPLAAVALIAGWALEDVTRQGIHTQRTHGNADIALPVATRGIYRQGDLLSLVTSPHGPLYKAYAVLTRTDLRLSRRAALYTA